MLETISLIIGISWLALGVLSGLLIKDYYEKFLEVEHYSRRWDTLSYGIILSSGFFLLFVSIQEGFLDFNQILDKVLLLIAPTGSFLVLLASIKLWHDFKFV